MEKRSCERRLPSPDRSADDGVDDVVETGGGDGIPASLSVELCLEHLVHRLSGSSMSTHLCHLLDDYRGRTQRMSAGDRASHLLRLCCQRPLPDQLQLLPPLNLLLVQSGSEKSRWQTWQLRGLTSISSPIGCRKAARRLRQLDAGVTVHVSRHAEAVWFFFCPSSRLQPAQLQRSRVLRSCTLVWFPGEPALYSCGTVASQRILSRLASMLGYVSVSKWPLCDVGLMSVRRRYVARIQRQARLAHSSTPTSAAAAGSHLSAATGSPQLQLSL